MKLAECDDGEEVKTWWGEVCAGDDAGVGRDRWGSLQVDEKDVDVVVQDGNVDGDDDDDEETDLMLRSVGNC